MRVCLLSILCLPTFAFSEGLFELEVGSYWVYEVSDKSSKRTVTNYIADEKQIEHIKWFQLIEYGEKFWIRNTDEGQSEAVNLYTMDTNQLDRLDAKVVREELMFKHPAKVGERWIILENYIEYTGQQTVEVPAGKFKCHMYSITQYEITYSHSCIAEGVGIIYADNLMENGEKEVSLLTEWGKQ